MFILDENVNQTLAVQVSNPSIQFMLYETLLQRLKKKRALSGKGADGITALEVNFWHKFHNLQVCPFRCLGLFNLCSGCVVLFSFSSHLCTFSLLFFWISTNENQVLRYVVEHVYLSFSSLFGIRFGWLTDKQTVELSNKYYDADFGLNFGLLFIWGLIVWYKNCHVSSRWLTSSMTFWLENKSFPLLNRITMLVIEIPLSSLQKYYFCSLMYLFMGFKFFPLLLQLLHML